jgi:hypothetical protein
LLNKSYINNQAKFPDLHKTHVYQKWEMYKPTKLELCTCTLRRRAGEGEVQFHLFLNSALNEGKCLTSNPGHLITPGAESHSAA